MEVHCGRKFLLASVAWAESHYLFNQSSIIFFFCILNATS